MRDVSIQRTSSWLLVLVLAGPSVEARESRREVNAQTRIRPAPLATADGSTVARWSDDRNAGEVAGVFTDTAAEGLLFRDGFEGGDTSAWN